jgi:hypothetical protein
MKSKHKTIENILGLPENNEDIKDFHVVKSNQTVAVYVVNPKMLQFDDPRQRGKPFLFYTGMHKATVPARELKDGMNGFRPFVGKSYELDQLLKGRVYQGKLPVSVKINGVEVSIDKLCSNRVPFCGGAFNEQDVETQRQRNDSITRLDYDQFVNRILPAYDAKKAEEKTFGYKASKFLAKLGI